MAPWTTAGKIYSNSIAFGEGLLTVSVIFYERVTGITGILPLGKNEEIAVWPEDYN
jgi:hypothetical protein